MTFHERYEAAAHRIQTAIGFSFGLDYSWMDGRLLTALKHLRVGIDTSKADQGGLVKLLIRKGVITEDEYFGAILEANEGEAELQQETLQRKMAQGNPDLKVKTL